MMRLPAQWQQEAVREAINAGEGAIWHLYIDGEPYHNLLEECVVDVGERAIVLDADIAGIYGDELWYAPVRCEVEIAGVTLRLMTGHLLRPELEGGMTALEGSSSGGFLADIPLGPPDPEAPSALPGAVEYPGVLADRVIADAARRAPYDMSRAMIRPGSGIPMQKTIGRGENYWGDTPVLEVMEDAEEHGSLTFHDTPDNSLICKPEYGLAEPGEIKWRYNADLLEDEDFRVTPVETQYTGVFVYARNQDGSRRAWAYARVDTSRMPHPPPARMDLWEAMDEGGTEEEAQEKADAKARRLARGVASAELSVPLNPLLTKGDVIAVSKTRRTALGSLRREYLMRIGTYKHTRSTQRSVFSGEATVLRETLTPYPIEPLAGLSGGVLQAPILAAGIDGQGWLFLDPEANADWFWVDEEGYLVVDPDLAGGRAYVDAENYLVIDI